MYKRKSYAIIMHTGNNSAIKFRDFCDDLYYFDTSVHDNPTNNRVSNYSFLYTVAEKDRYFTRQ